MQLNGHPVPGVAQRAGGHRVLLDQANGLRVGQNVLWVSRLFRGSEHPVQVANRFVVGYPVGDLLTSSGVQLGAEAAPAALVKVQAPLAGVNR